MTRRAALVVLGSLLLLGFTRSSAWQDLPASLRADILPPTRWATKLKVPLAGSPGDLVIASIGFANISDPSVHLGWRYRSGTSAPASEVQVEEVSYLPTAVCAGSPTGNTLYVAGWYPETEVAVIEKWTVGSFALGDMVLPSGGSVSTMIQPDISRRMVFMAREDNAFPIRAMVSDAFNQQLYLLPEVSFPPLVKVDVASGSFGATPINASAYPYMEHARTLDVGLLAPPPGGVPSLIVTVSDVGRYDVTEKVMAHGSGEILVLTDYAVDGAFNSAEVLSMDAYREQYPRSVWDLWYTAP